MIYLKKILKKLYQKIPFKQQLFEIMKKILPFPVPEWIYRHLHFTGIIEVSLPGNKTFKMKHYGYQIENEIFWSGLTGGWEKESMKIWMELCKQSEVIMDIGANTGVYSLVAKTINPKAQVYAFEPVERVFSKLQENIAINNFDIVAIQKAVSNLDGTAVIYDIPSSEHIYSVTVNKNLYSPTTKVEEVIINTVTLNSFIRQNNIQRVDLIKIDVETHEPQVLEGFSDYLSRYKPTMLIEILNDDVAQKIHNILKNTEYLYFNINEKGGIRQISIITKSDYYNYLICNYKTAKILGLLC